MKFADIREGTRLIWRRGGTVQVVSVAIATTTPGGRVLRVRPSGSLRAYNAVPADLYDDGEAAARDAFGWVSDKEAEVFDRLAAATSTKSVEPQARAGGRPARRRSILPEETTRERILCLLEDRKEPLSVTVITLELGAARASVSGELSKLAKLGLVRRLRRGQYEAVAAKGGES